MISNIPSIHRYHPLHELVYFVSEKHPFFHRQVQVLGQMAAKKLRKVVQSSDVTNIKIYIYINSD